MKDILYNEIWYREKYLQEGLSIREIAKLCDKYSAATIYRKFQEYGIPMRSSSESLLLRYKRKSHNRKGKKLTEEHKKNISKALTGRKLTESHVRNLSKSLTGIKRTEEFKKNLSMFNTKERTGMKNPNWKGGLIKRKCLTCGKIFEAKPSVINKGNAVYCSKRCAGKTRVGKQSWNWQGGKSFEPYCYLFNNELKEEIRNRDNRVCVLCGKSEILNGERLSVHHIDGDKMQGCNDKQWALVSLCNSCNSKSDTIEKEFLIITNSEGLL